MQNAGRQKATRICGAEEEVLARCVVLDDELDFAGHGDLGTKGATRETRLQLVELDLEVRRKLRQEVDVTTGGSNLERLEALAGSVDVNELARLDAERRAVNALAINEDVTVNDELASLSRGASDRGTDEDRVETHLEQLDQVLTGQAGAAAGFLEHDLHLCFADAVLGA